jgi:hypothetical protein
MSTISLPHEKQIRHFFVADALASQTTQADFIKSAAIGEMQIFGQGGGAIDNTSGELVGKDFFLLKKNNKGGISRTDLITPKDITYLKGVKPVDKVGKVQKFTLAAAPTKGAEYIMTGKINYGNSEENFVTFWSGAKAKDGDTANSLLRRLAKQISEDLGRSIHTSAKANSGKMQIATAPVVEAEPNKYFTVAVAGSVLTITERDWILDDYRVGLRTHDQLMFNFEISSKEDEQDNIAKEEIPGVYARGKGYQMIELERFLVGHRAEFETSDVTLSFGRKYDTEVGKDYFVLELKYFDISRDSAKHSDKMLTLVSTDSKVIDKIGYAIEASMGKAEGTAWTELDAAGDGTTT